MKEINFNKSIGKNYHLEINSCYVYPNIQPIPFGFRVAIGHKGIFLRFSFILEIDINVRWNCDHAGCNILIDTPLIQLLDLEFYNINHKN